MLLSIVIPVYNADKYLGTCLKSIVKAAKTAKLPSPVEIVLVDNISTDNSVPLIKSYMGQYRRSQLLSFKLYECDRAGASCARNLGASKARGRYLWFIDADDTIAPKSIKELVATAEAESADLVMMGVQRVYDPGAKNTDGKRDYLAAIDQSDPKFRSKFIRYGLGPWQVLIRRGWWNQRKFYFREGIIHEDMELMSSLILFTDHFASINKPFYNYRQTAGSVLHKSEWDIHSLDIFPALEGLYRRFRRARASALYHDELEWFFIWNLLLDSARDFSGHPEGREGFRETRRLLKEYFPNWRKNQFLREKPWKTRLRIRLNYHKT